MAEEQSGSTRVDNTDKDNAKVEAQIGVVEGDAVFHKHETIYNVKNSDSPEKKYEVGRKHLDGGIPRVAEDLIGQALDAELASSEVAYYYAISVLSERSLNQLGPKELDKFERAVIVAQRFDLDIWQRCLQVIRELLLCALRPEVAETNALQLVLDRFKALPMARQTEITRHLDMILDGAIQDQLDRVNAENAARQRSGADRADRAWKYFQPDPAEPRRAVPIPLREPLSMAWFLAVVGVLAFAVGILLSSRTAHGIGPLVAPLGVFLAGATIAAVCGSFVQAVQIRRRLREIESAYLPEPLDTSDEAYENLKEWEKFHDEIAARIDYYFKRYRPTTVEKDQWRSETRGAKAALYSRLIRLYDSTQVRPTTLNWLIRWHARKAAEQWRAAKKLPDVRTVLPFDTPTALATWLGVVITGFGMILLVNAASRLGVAPTAISLLELAAGCAGAYGIAYVFGDRRAMIQERAGLSRLYDDERHEYERWCARLSDRPSDIEMANWLEFDKSYLKTLAMRHADLKNRDIIAHVVLTEGKHGAKRARVRNGPPRFSVYFVLVFLLTENGVRGMRINLNFVSAAIYNEERIAFRYDALASAKVLEVGFKLAKAEPAFMLKGKKVRLKKSVVMQRLLHLSLIDSDLIKVIVDNFDGLLDESTDEDKSHLDRLALDSSGVTVALHILEAVAGEGREWLAKERARRERRLRDWADSRANRALIDGGTWEPGVEPLLITMVRPKLG